MVDLPKVPIPDTVTQPVRTSISSAEVAAPYAEIAHGLDKTGEMLTETSVELAKIAGEQAVRTDDAGNLVVDKAPLLVGPAAPAFARAARMTYATKLQPQIETDMLKLRLENPNNPEAFKAAATNYKAEKLSQVDDPTLKVGIDTMISTNAAHNYRTSLIETNQNQVSDAMESYKSRIKDMNEKGSTLARQGGTETPEYQSLAHDRAALYKELGDDPRFKFSPERAALEMRENRDNDVGQAVIGQAQRIFQTKQNAAAAQKFLQDAFWGEGSEKLNLSASKRDHFVAEGMHALANISAIDRQAIAENASGVKQYITDRFKNPALYDEGAYNDLRQRSRDIGDVKSEQDLIRFRDLLPTAQNLKKMGPEQATVALSQMARGNLPDNISFAGIPDRFISGIKQSEGFQSRAQWDYKQFTNGYGTRATHSAEVIDKETADRRFDTEISKAAKVVDAVNPTLDAGTRAALTSLTFNAGSSWVNGTLGQRVAAGDIAGARSAFLGYNRAGGQVLPGLVNRRVQEASWFGQDEAPGTTQLRPGEHVDLGTDNGISRQFQNLVHIQRERNSAFAQVSYDHIVQAVKDRDQFKPGELENFAENAHLSGRDDLLEKAGPLLAAKDIQDKLPEGTSAAVVEQQIRALEASGVSGTERAVLKQLHENVRADAANLRAAPLRQGAIEGHFAAINPLTPDNTQAFVGEIQDRQRKSVLLQQHHPDIGPISLIDKDEATELGAKLTSGDPAQAANALQALKTIPDANYLPTMVALKDPIINMSRSNDPTRFGAGMTALATLWQAHKPEFDAVFGGEAKNRMLAFQGLQGSLDVPAIIAQMNEADSPAKAKAKKDIGEAVDEETKKWAPSNVASLLGSSWKYTPDFISRAIGTTPSVSTSELVAGEMKHDFIDTYKALREYGVDKDTASAKAVEGLKSEWQPSQVNSGVLMKHAPETHYPEIAGNHDWMRAELMDHITSVLGPEASSGAPSSGRFRPGPEDPFAETIGEGFGSPKVNWTFQGLISDDQTEREVKSPPGGPDGRPRGPSYQVTVMDDRGQTQILPDRFWWDPAAPTATYADRQRGVFDARRSNIDAMKPYQGVTGPM